MREYYIPKIDLTVNLDAKFSSMYEIRVKKNESAVH